MRISFQKSVQNAVFVSAAAIACAACEEWPRYQNKPSINQNALDAGADPSNGVDVSWDEIAEAEEPNDAPTDGIDIEVGQGITVLGALDGLGWDPEASAERMSECGTALAFPPAAPGAYTGDVDWISIKPAAEGQLCLHLQTDHPTARLDAALYVLDECNEPVGVFVHPENNVPIGLDVAAANVQWAIGVNESVHVAVGIAGFFPDDDELSLNWEGAIALVPSVAGASDALCPGVQ